MDPGDIFPMKRSVPSRMQSRGKKMTKLDRMKELVKLLNEAGRAYYQESREIMSNFEYDKLYDELQALEKETGQILSDSPTVHVGYEVLSALPKEVHASPMLSLDKTKDVDTLAAFLGTHKGLISWKLDGLTVVLTYQNGQLLKAVTRGNGEIGEVITNNAKVFKNIPLAIPYKGTLVVRGEAVIRYSDFKKINEGITEEEGKYKNPRNLCAGSVRQLSNKITAERNVYFYAFTLVSAEDVDFHNSVEGQYDWLALMGFSVVEHYEVTKDTMHERVAFFADKIKDYDLPSDGLVVVFDDIAYGRSLGRTAKFPRNGLAFKWADEMAETTLREIEWSPSRTGLINPVAIFDPVFLEGTTVSRASVHNVSIVEDLKLGINDTIKVYKANMIIPQIEENLTKSGTVQIPDKCPACGKATQIDCKNGTRTLVCPNPECPAKHIKRFTHFVSRNAMNIDGLSEETIKKFVDHGLIHEFADIFRLGEHRDEILSMEGFQEKSVEKLTASIEKARDVDLPNFVYSLGIPNIGLSNAKLICKACGGTFEQVWHADKEKLAEIDGIGDVIAEAVAAYFTDEMHQKMINDLLQEVRIRDMEIADTEHAIFAGKTFVITGSVHHFANRNALKARIEELGGKATGSVSAKTDYLINNDAESTSSKNKKAKELGIPIITEDEFLSMINEG